MFVMCMKTPASLPVSLFLDSGRLLSAPIVELPAVLELDKIDVAQGRDYRLRLLPMNTPVIINQDTQRSRSNWFLYFESRGSWMNQSGRVVRMEGHLWQCDSVTPVTVWQPRFLDHPVMKAKTMTLTTQFADIWKIVMIFDKIIFRGLKKDLVSLDRVDAELTKLNWLMTSYLVEAQNVS